MTKQEVLARVSPAFYSGLTFYVTFDADRPGVSVPEKYRGRTAEVRASKDTGACVVGDNLCLTVNETVLVVPFSAVLKVAVVPRLRLVQGGKK